MNWLSPDSAPRDGSHFIGLVIDPPEEDDGVRWRQGCVQAEEVWFEPGRAIFGEPLPWRSGGYGHDGRLGCKSFGGGLLLGWIPLPAITPEIAAEAHLRHITLRPSTGAGL